jgi:ribosome-associated translation inhibitor RaiA
MEIIISTINFKTDTSLETYVREKVSKLFNHCNTIIRANVILREGEKGTLGNKQCEIRLIIPGYDHFVKKNTDVYEKSVSQAVEVMQKILRRKKNRIIAKRYSNSVLAMDKTNP